MPKRTGLQSRPVRRPDFNLGDRAPLEDESSAKQRPAGPFKLEHRRALRTPAKGELQATYSDHHDRAGITRLELIDQSHQGLGVRSRVPIEPGMTVTICPPGSTIPWIAAECVRCRREGTMHIIGLRLSRSRAA